MAEHREKSIERSEVSGQARLKEIAVQYPLPATTGLELRYALLDGEVWVHKRVSSSRGEGEKQTYVPLSTPFCVPAWLCHTDPDRATELRVVVRDMEGFPRSLDIERSELAASSALKARKALLHHGMRFAVGGEVGIADVLRCVAPNRKILLVKRPGWIRLESQDDPFFVCPSGEVFGCRSEHDVELAASSKIAHPLAIGGSPQGWSEAARVALSVQGCPHFALGLLSAFAGVLVSLIEADSCGISFSGLSSSGKTTAQRLAASAWAKPVASNETLFQTAKTTINAVEAVASRANGTVLVLDELAHVGGKELAQLIYTIASNVGKSRMTAEAAERKSYTWSTFAVLSAETSLGDKVRQDGGSWTTGQTVRIIDVDVTGTNRNVDAAIMARIESVVDHYGHAGPLFVKRFIEASYHRERGGVEGSLARYTQRLVEDGARKSDAATLRAARIFAYLGIAGVLAVEFGILPDDVDIFGVVQWSWQRFRSSSASATLDVGALAIDNLRTWIAERWDTSIQRAQATVAKRLPTLAWYDAHVIYVPAARLVEAAGGVLKEAEIARALEDRGLIVKRKDEDCRFVSYVPGFGRLKAYALSRSEFGRDPDEAAVVKMHVGGRP